MGAALDVAVIGAGTAGSAAAMFLARAGHRVTVYERVAEPGPVGAGISLQPTGQAVLARLGLLAPILERAARIDRLHVMRHAGKTLVDLRYADVDRRWFGLGLHRGTLFVTLFEAVRREPGVTLHLGAEINSVTRTPDAITVHGPDGPRGEHELVVVADGAVSELHASAGVPVRTGTFGFGALWFVAEDPDQAFRDVLYQVVRGARRMYGVLPTGRGPTDARPVVSLYWSLALGDHARWQADGLDAWKREVLSFDPRVGPVLDQITAPEQVLLARYRDVRMARWHGDRIVFLGDAAHATSPQLGNGANLALVDAMVLADTLAETPALAAALPAYSRARRRHVGHYQRMSRLLTPLFQSNSRALGWLRDAFMPLADRIGPSHRLMVKTMAGHERGLVGRAPLALPPPS
ncbi:MAG: FAD-dependent monooxygenase [Myxococcales bacterium]|nr:FAD-dependent monooxygenase [Myxococcales bacterium]